MTLNITLVGGFDPVPAADPVVLASYTRGQSTVELCRYPGAVYSVRTVDGDDPQAEETFTDPVVASLAYHEQCAHAWADWTGELEDMRRHAHEQRLEDLACAIDMLGIVAVAEEISHD